MTRTALSLVVAAFVSLPLAGCVTPRPSAAAAPQPPPQQAGGDVPFMPGPLPNGWKLEGVYLGVVQFVRPDADSSVAFVFFSSATNSPASMIRRAAAENGAKKGVTITAIDAPDGGTEASLRFEDERIGSKRGRLVARCFPGRTIHCVLIAGLWHADREERGLEDYEAFLAWVRVDK